MGATGSNQRPSLVDMLCLSPDGADLSLASGPGASSYLTDGCRLSATPKPSRPPGHPSCRPGTTLSSGWLSSTPTQAPSTLLLKPTFAQGMTDRRQWECATIWSRHLAIANYAATLTRRSSRPAPPSGRLGSDPPREVLPWAKQRTHPTRHLDPWSASSAPTHSGLSLNPPAR